MPLKSATASRRRFLASVGATAATLPFLRVLPSYAQSDCTPKLITVFSGNGRVRHLWGGSDGPGGLQLRPNFAPLEPFKQHLLITEGIINRAAAEIGGTHEGGMRSLWTGNGKDDAHPSIDQLMMSQAGAGLPRSDSLYQQVVAKLNTAENATPNNRMAFDASGTPRDPLRSGTEVVQQFFGSMLPASAGDPQKAKQGIAQAALYDALNSQLSALLPRLCGEDRYQLEGMQTAVATVRNTVVKDCALPTVPADPASQPWERAWRPPADTLSLSATDDWYRARCRTAVDLTVAALACGVTRASALQFDQAASEAVAVGHGQHHHDISHGVPQLNSFVKTLQSAAQPPYMEVIGDTQRAPDPELLQTFGPVWSKLSEWELFYAEQVAYLLQQLDAFGILKDTLLVWGGEIDNGQHAHYNMPFVLAAGECIPIRRGHVVTFPTSFDDQRIAVTPAGSVRTQQDLLRTVLHAVGVDVQSVGAVGHNQGLLTELLLP